MRILETALYCEDVARAAAFYRETLGLTVMVPGERLTAMDAGDGSVLLLFLRGASAEGVGGPGAWIPPHDGAGPAHIAFAVPAAELPALEARLARRGIAIESRIVWPRGGKSLYFRDPDGHSVELATPGVWENY